MRQTYREGSDATDRGLDITIHLAPAEMAALGADASLLTDWHCTALAALVALRTRQTAASLVGDDRQETVSSVPGPDYWYWPINDLHTRLLPRLTGILDAAIREHAATGGTYGHLKLAMDAPHRSTAQRRRDSITTSATPSYWEHWARTGGPTQPRTSEWSAEVWLLRPDPSPHTEPGTEITTSITITGLTAAQARDLESLITDDADHSVTITTARGVTHTLRAPDVQVVKVSQTRSR